MPRYHFHVYDTHSRLDERGAELLDIETAKIAAQRFAGECIRDAAIKGRILEEWRVEVTDPIGLMLYRMDFMIMASPAL